MKQLGFLIHHDDCIGCRSCEFACKNEHGHQDTFRRKIHSCADDPDRAGHSFHHISMACNHCESPACMAVCPENAIKKKQNGMVILDQSKCTGCSKCTAACPFDAITINPITAKADKCDMCSNRQAQGLSPICVSACPVKAIEIINLHDPKNDHYNKVPYGFEMKKLTNPSIRFQSKKKQSVQFWLQG